MANEKDGLKNEEIENNEAAEVNEAELSEKSKKKKQSKKDLEIESLKAELSEKTDLLKRTAAEFDNFKKRTERERASVIEYAKANLVKNLLPILDNIERANTADKESPEYIKGIEMIIKQFNSLGDTLSVTPIGEKGEKFDPNFHEAVMHIEDEAFGENEIAEVLQKGYKLGDTVLRPAMVKVAN